MGRRPRAAPSVSNAESRHALEAGDDLVQTLTVAKYSLCVGDVEAAMDAIDSALAVSRHAITDLVEAIAAARDDESETMLGLVLRSRPAAVAKAVPKPRRRT